METMGCAITLKHAVVSLPVPPPHSIPEAQGLGPFITLMDRHVAAAVQSCFQGTPAWETWQRLVQAWEVSAAQNDSRTNPHITVSLIKSSSH